MHSDPALPPPTAAALEHSHALAARIRARIERAGGWIDFAEYMKLALYEPGLGYYMGGSVKLGAGGDFVTAPELGPLFGRALAVTVGRELEALASGAILELGAGSGALAEHVLTALDAAGTPAVRYLILEPSADLRARQQERLRAFGARVTWLDALPREPIDGVILANEVVDALPAERFVIRRGTVRPLGVAAERGTLAWREGAEQAPLTAAVRDIEAHLPRPLADGYRSEVRLLLPAWLASLGAALARGSLLFVDYGLVRREYYHPERTDGTLICHYRHRAHTDPFLHPGLQDLSVWVDFSACAAAGAQARLELAGFTTQAQYLLGVLSAEPRRLSLENAAPRELAALKTLVLPGEMGERFKVMLLRKGHAGPALPGRDFRARL
jgi:SAM-dependent MidA family methyltransferase